MGWDFTLEQPNSQHIKSHFESSWESPEGIYSITDATWTAFGTRLWGILRLDGKPVEIALWIVDCSQDEA